MMNFSQDAIELKENYFEKRTMHVEIGGSRGLKRSSGVGVLQGSGLSIILFLIYFLRVSVAVRDSIAKPDIKSPVISLQR